MTSFASIYIVIALFIIFMPMMMCSHEEEFGDYDPKSEFAADDIHEAADREQDKDKESEEHAFGEAHPAGAAGGGAVTINDDKGDAVAPGAIEMEEIALDDGPAPGGVPA